MGGVRDGIGESRLDDGVAGLLVEAVVRDQRAVEPLPVAGDRREVGPGAGSGGVGPPQVEVIADPARLRRLDLAVLDG
ncbi:hypothetical protein ACH4VT_16000 [Streptomyces lydicus]|uniref:hypothetical protein n=1 Tax=Streptomyces lydicus TaxID=47763 RepID=UPI0037AC5BE5